MCVPKFCNVNGIITEESDVRISTFLGLLEAVRNISLQIPDSGELENTEIQNN